MLSSWSLVSVPMECRVQSARFKWKIILIIYDCDRICFKRHRQLWLIEYGTKKLNMTQGHIKCKIVFGWWGPHVWSSPRNTEALSTSNSDGCLQDAWWTKVRWCLDPPLWSSRQSLMRWPGIMRERLPGTDAFVKSLWGSEGRAWVTLGKATSESSFTHSTISCGEGPSCQARWCWGHNSPCPHGAPSSRESLSSCLQHWKQMCLVLLERALLCLIPLCSCRFPKS